jgi:hypothetical protein
VKHVILLGLSWSLAVSLAASEGSRIVWSARFALPPGGVLAVNNVQGAVSVEGWERPEVAVTVTKTALAPTDRLDDVRVSAESGAGYLRLRTLYPNNLEEPIRVDYQLYVPRRLRIERLRTLVGDINVRDLEGPVDARSLLGDITEQDVAGPVVAQALTGNIVVWLRALPDPSTPLLLDTVNGNLDLLLPPRADADLELRTVAGRIEGKYLFDVSATPGDGTRRARVGRGGVRVRLQTIRGNIRVGEREDLL